MRLLLNGLNRRTLALCPGLQLGGIKAQFCSYLMRKTRTRKVCAASCILGCSSAMQGIEFILRRSLLTCHPDPLPLWFAHRVPQGR